MEEKKFKDLFSSDSGQYKSYRPQYPAELFEALAAICGKKDLAWDCGTGNGQAAINLSTFFKRVIATDPSAEQLKHAHKRDNIEYRCETAENPSLTDHCSDIVCIAQALHWFDFEKFYQEVRRVVVPGGVIAAIAYGLPITDEKISFEIKHLHNIVLAKYWEQERQLVADLYRDVPFPFEKIEFPEFVVRREMTRVELLGYLNTWSGLKACIKATGINPLEDFNVRLNSCWPNDTEMVEFQWKLALRIGRV